MSSIEERLINDDEIQAPLLVSDPNDRTYRAEPHSQARTWFVLAAVILSSSKDFF